ncbi:MAG: co-chaperone GroES [Calditrichia bacterium]|nr:co-chaperone GroES [Calditrichia bacterium]
MASKKQLIVVGDRVLVKPDDSMDKTNFGLYLPQGIEEKEKIQSGFVFKTGPGYPLPDPSDMGEEPWSQSQKDAKYVPLQVEEGDYIIFLRKAAIEIEFERKKYLILPQSAILLIVRDDILNKINPEG